MHSTSSSDDVFADPGTGDDPHQTHQTNFMKKLGIMAISILAYSAIGGAVFYALESPVQERRLKAQNEDMLKLRNELVGELLELMAAIEQRNESRVTIRNVTESWPDSKNAENSTTIDEAVMEYFQATSNETSLGANAPDLRQNSTDNWNSTNPEPKIQSMDLENGGPNLRLTRTEFFYVNASGLEIEMRAYLEQRTRAAMMKVLQVKRCEDELTWDFFNAWLYACTLITTIGYGHIAPETNWGRVATMLYALIGIPLMLVCLSDLGVFLTQIMKFPWFACKFVFRRCFRCCLGLTIDEIRQAEEHDKMNLKVFDLPVPVAIGIVVGWTFVCAAVQMIWEHESWDYLVAFYFFFISLTTIGLGDIAPANPHYLLMMFLNILIGLSLLSMCINLISMKLEKAAAGRDDQDSLHSDDPAKQRHDGSGRRQSLIKSALCKGTASPDSPTHQSANFSIDGGAIIGTLEVKSSRCVRVPPEKQKSAPHSERPLKKHNTLVAIQHRRQSRVHSIGSSVGTGTGSIAVVATSLTSDHRSLIKSPSSSTSNLNDSFYDNHHLVMRMERAEARIRNRKADGVDSTDAGSPAESPESADLSRMRRLEGVLSNEGIVRLSHEVQCEERRCSDEPLVPKRSPVKEVFI